VTVNRKLRVAVLFGGRSGEHEVSIQSAKSIMAALDRAKYDVLPVGITRDGQWIAGEGAVAQLEAAARVALGAATDAIAEKKEAEAGSASVDLVAALDVRAVAPLEWRTWPQTVDVVIPALHGSFGEDGTIQGLLEVLGIPYVGAGVLASAAGMDKVVMKKLFAAAGLPQVRYTSYLRAEIDREMDRVVSDIERQLGYPCFVKPANLGSSVGISKVKRRDDLPQALRLAARYDRKVIVEEGLNVREIEVAVLGNDHPEASVPGEIVPSNEFYDYQAKYMDGKSMLIIPAPIDDDTALRIRELAIAAFQAIDCSGLARVDFFLERDTGRILVNEINTMPGFTRFSMYPKLWEASGVSYPELLDRLIRLALERYEERRRSDVNLHFDAT
jgi:D-alanine-D-alanine ligase